MQTENQPIRSTCNRGHQLPSSRTVCCEILHPVKSSDSSSGVLLRAVCTAESVTWLSDRSRQVQLLSVSTPRAESSNRLCKRTVQSVPHLMMFASLDCRLQAYLPSSYCQQRRLCIRRKQWQHFLTNFQQFLDVSPKAAYRRKACSNPVNLVRPPETLLVLTQTVRLQGVRPCRLLAYCLTGRGLARAQQAMSVQTDVNRSGPVALAFAVICAVCIVQQLASVYETQYPEISQLCIPSWKPHASL